MYVKYIGNKECNIYYYRNFNNSSKVLNLIFADIFHHNSSLKKRFEIDHGVSVELLWGRGRLLSECGSQIQVNLSNKVSPVLATAPAKIFLVVKEAFIFNKIS